MSNRFSLGNRFLRISLAQFAAITGAFRSACEKSFNTPASLEIRLYSEPLVFTTFMDDEIQENLDGINRHKHLMSTAELGAVSEKLWQEAGYAQVNVRPVNEALAPVSAFAHLEFKGYLPKLATFYVQPEDPAVQAALEAQFGRMLVGDGYADHGRRSEAVPASILCAPFTRKRARSFSPF